MTDPFSEDYSNKNRKRILIAIVLVVVLLAAFIPWVYLLYTPPVTVKRRIKKDVYVQEKVGPGEKYWIPYDSISKHLLHAIVASEDARFYEHSGLDFTEIKSSVEKNLRKKRYARGASTITQQVVKMALLSPEKTLLRKGREAVGALLLDAVMTKNEILTWYVNLVEFGRGIYGVDRAAQSYFSSRPHLLSVAQSIHLALILPSPEVWSAGLRKKSLTSFGHRRFASILLRMRQMGYITDQQRRETLATGDFGRPIQGYENLTQDLNESMTPRAGDIENRIPEPDAQEDDGDVEETISSPNPPTVAPAPSQIESVPPEVSPAGGAHQAPETVVESSSP